jgi:hypothetical protein
VKKSWVKAQDNASDSALYTNFPSPAAFPSHFIPLNTARNLQTILFYCGILAYPEIRPIPLQKGDTVATFCQKCGSELSPGAQICSACGATVIALAAAPVPPQPVPPPARSGNNALKIVLIVLAVFIGLGILGAGAFGFFVWRVAHSVHVSGDKITVNTPGGTFSTNTSEVYTAAELGTDIYPGAQSGKGSMRMKLPNGTMISAVFSTSDSKDQVLAFYKEKFGSDASIFDSGEGTVLTLTKGDHESVVVTIVRGSGSDEGKTLVHIVHTTTSTPS